MKNIIKNIYHSGIAVMLLVLIPGMAGAQYYQGTGTITTAASPGGISDLNCDTRNFNNLGTGQQSPMNAIAYDNYNAEIYWNWQDGPIGGFYQNTIPLSSTSFGADVVILYNNTYISTPYIGVVYFDYLYGNVVFEIYKFSLSTHDFTLDSYHTYSASPTWTPHIDADARGNFVLAWDSGLQLHTVGGNLITGGIKVGPEKTLPFPSGITEALYTDVALYGVSSPNDCRAYYTYVADQFNGRTLVVQTQKLNNIINLNTAIPSTVYHSYSYTTSSSYYFIFPRIAANMFDFQNANGAEELEYTVVCPMYDVASSTESSIFAMTSYNNSGTFVPTEYNITSDNFTGAPYNQDAFLNSGGYMTPENISNPTTCVNSRPVVAYDRDNTHVIICWSMKYDEGTYTNFPTKTSYFPAMVYANPVPTSYSSLQPTVNVGGNNICEIYGLDNTAGGSLPSDATYIAVAGHNTNDILYAWFDGNGDINYKYVTSGSPPRQGVVNSVSNDHFVYPNPWNREGASIRLDLEPNQQYTMKVVNVLGQFILNVSGYKDELVSEINASLKNCDPGIYQVNISDGNTQVANTKLSVY